MRGQQCNEWLAHEEYISSIDIANNGKFVATGSEDSKVKLWTSMSKERDDFLDYGVPSTLHDFELPEGVTSVAISPDCRLIAACSLDSLVYVWDVETGSMTAKLTDHLDSVYSVSFTPSSSHVISTSLDKTLRLWELDPTVQKTPETESFGHSSVQVYRGHAVCVISFVMRHSLIIVKDCVYTATSTPDNSWILSSGRDRSVRVVDAFTGAVQCVLVGHKNSGEYIIQLQEAQAFNLLL